MLLLTSPDCSKCQHLKTELSRRGINFTERPGSDLKGCEDWRPLVGVLAELSLRDWDGELPVVISDGKVMFFDEACRHFVIEVEACANGTCKL